MRAGVIVVWRCLQWSRKMEAASFLWAVRRVRDDASLGEATASLEGVNEELLIQQGDQNLAR